MNIIDIGKMLLRKLWLIIIITVIVASAAFCISNFVIKKQYSSSANFAIGFNFDVSSSSESSTIGNAFTLAQRVVGTCIDYLSQNTFYDKLSEELDNDGIVFSSNSLANAITYEQKYDKADEATITFSAEVVCGDAATAQKIAIKLKSIVPTYIDDHFPIKSQGNSVIVVDPMNDPELKTSHVSPSNTVNTLIGVVVGLVFSILLSVLLEVVNNNVKTEEDLVSGYQLPVFGVIPKIADADKKQAAANAANPS